MSAGSSSADSQAGTAVAAGQHPGVAGAIADLWHTGALGKLIVGGVAILIAWGVVVATNWLFLLLASALWVYYDATKHGIGRIDGLADPVNMPAGAWAAATGVVWVLFFPGYLIKREQLLTRAAEKPQAPARHRNRILGALAALALASLFVPTDLGARKPVWDKLAWGMQPDEVKALYPEAAEKEGALLLSSNVIAGVQFSGKLDFGEDRGLQRIALTTGIGDPAQYAKVHEWLSGQYGRPKEGQVSGGAEKVTRGKYAWKKGKTAVVFEYQCYVAGGADLEGSMEESMWGVGARPEGRIVFTLVARGKPAVESSAEQKDEEE